jgi:hypothetical protein
MDNLENEKKQELQTVDSTTTTALTTGVSVQDFQSFFYLINAKPDRETKFFRENKVVSVSSIIELNDLIQEKLQLHEIITNQVSVVVSLNNNRTLEYGTWTKFLDEKWHTAAVTKNVTVTWDFTVKLPGYKFPQRHTVKLRIGQKLRPKDMFELVMNHEDEEQLFDAFSHTICSIDFINPVISSEIFRIVETWHEALPKNFYTSRLHSFLRKHSKKIETLVIFLVLLAGCTFLYGASRTFLSYVWTDSFDQTFYSRIFGGLLLASLTLFLFYHAGQLWANGTAKFINRLRTAALFSFTKGDLNANDESSKKNNDIIKAIGAKIGITVIVNILAFILDKFWDLFSKMPQ